MYKPALLTAHSRRSLRRAPGTDLGLPLPARDDSELWCRKGRGRSLGRPDWCSLLHLAEPDRRLLGPCLRQVRPQADYLDRAG